MAAFSALEMKNEQKQHVYVTVRGGVAYTAEVPDGIELHILDFDDLEADYATTIANYSEDERNFLHNLKSKETLP